MKSKLLITLLICMFGLTACSSGFEEGMKDAMEETQEETENESDQNVISEGSEETKDTQEEESSEESEEDPLGFNVMFSSTYKNDVTGNWRLARIAEDIDIENYAEEYYKNYFESDDEIHIIINFTRNTTTRINKMGNLLDVTIMDYVDGEEHDAKVACSGTLIAEYHVNLDSGEISKIQ